MIIDAPTHMGGSMGIQPASVLPSVGVASDELLKRLDGGQPVLLVHDGQPAAVIIDYDSWLEIEEVWGAGE